MKAILALSGFLLLANVILADDANEFLQKMQTIYDSCYESAKFTKEDIEDAMKGKGENMEQTFEQLNGCIYQETGFLDGSDIRNEALCQSAQKYFGEDMGDNMCNVINRCAELTLSAPEANKAASTFTQCMLEAFVIAFRLGLSQI